MRIFRLLAATSLAALTLAAFPAAQLDTVQAQQNQGLGSTPHPRPHLGSLARPRRDR